MRPSDYPPQEPFSEVAQRYHDTVTKLGARTPPGEEIQLGEDPYRSLVIYPSAAPDGRILAFMHGGGWTNGYKEWLAFMAPALNAAGVTFASLGYRLAPQHLFPAGYEDAAAGLVRLMAEATRFGGDPERLYVGGHSAGGHYAALLATRDHWWRMHGLEENPLAGCLPISGVFKFGEGSGMAMRPRFLGSEDPDADRIASPISLIEDKTPFLIAHGDRDFPHLMAQAEEMEGLLRAHLVPVERLIVTGADHFTASTWAGNPQGLWLPRALNFMQ
ncbi:MAG: alpha/beta hydrolase [Kiloniellales bacterium]